MDNDASTLQIDGNIHTHRWHMDSHIPNYHSWMSIPKDLRTRAGDMKKGGTMTRDSTRIISNKGFMVMENIKVNVINTHYFDVNCQGQDENKWHVYNAQLTNKKSIIYVTEEGMSIQNPLQSSCANDISKDMEIWRSDLRIHGKRRANPLYSYLNADIMANSNTSNLFNGSPYNSLCLTTFFQYNTLSISMFPISSHAMASSIHPLSATPLQTPNSASSTPQCFRRHPSRLSQESQSSQRQKRWPIRPPYTSTPPLPHNNKNLCVPLTKSHGRPPPA